MSLASLLQQPVTVQTIGVTGTDSLGNETHGVTSSASTVAYVARTGADEVSGDQQTEGADWTVFLPVDTVITGYDRIVSGLLVLEVIGPPEQVWNPRTGVYSHVRLKARSVTS